uniref:Zinc transporter ZIP1 n=1 Tax=Aceria tosichella TaxID=561515 RepID=A0A6G1SG56_9ACAR
MATTLAPSMPTMPPNQLQQPTRNESTGGNSVDDPWALSDWLPMAMNNDITQTKLIASLVLFVITLLFGYVPVRIILNQNYIQHAMFAGGGVLMATAFCHLIPEAHDGYKNAIGATGHVHSHSHSHNNNDHEHQDYHTNDDHNQQHLNQQHNNSVIHQINETIAILNGTNTHTNTTTGHLDHDSLHATTTIADSQQQQHLYVPYPEVALCCGFIFMYVVEQLFLRFVNNHTHEHPGGDTSTGQLIGSQPKRSSAPGVGGSPGVGGLGLGELEAERLSVDQRDSTSAVVLDGGSVSDLPSGARRAKGSASTTGAFYKFIRGLLIVSAFSLHSIFDGVAIGSQDSIEKVWTIFFAISCHKLIIVAVVGFELFSATLESHLWTLIHLTIFSIMSPIGILLVIVAQNSLKVSSDDPAIILLQSFATGTLLYIIFVEILQPKEDRFHARNRSTKILSLILGFAAMVTILTFMHED